MVEDIEKTIAKAITQLMSAISAIDTSMDEIPEFTCRMFSADGNEYTSVYDGLAATDDIPKIAAFEEMTALFMMPWPNNEKCVQRIVEEWETLQGRKAMPGLIQACILPAIQKDLKWYQYCRRKASFDLHAFIAIKKDAFPVHISEQYKTSELLDLYARLHHRLYDIKTWYPSEYHELYKQFCKTKASYSNKDIGFMITIANKKMHIYASYTNAKRDELSHEKIGTYEMTSKESFETFFEQAWNTYVKALPCFLVQRYLPDETPEYIAEPTFAM